MLHVGLDFPIDAIEEVLRSTVTELERNLYKTKNPGPKDDLEVILVLSFVREVYSVCFTIVFMIFRRKWIVI